MIPIVKMGVKLLKKYLKDNGLVNQIYVTEFTNKKIVVDASPYIYQYKAIFGNGWMSAFVNFVNMFKRYNIHCNFLFDGKPPKEKDGELNDRKTQKDKLEKDLLCIEKEFSEYIKSGKVGDTLAKVSDRLQKKDGKSSVLAVLVSKLKESKEGNELTNDLVQESKLQIDPERIQEYIDKRKKQNIRISKKDIKKLKGLLSYLGIHWIQSPGEAEALGSYLCNIGKADAILSEDSDVLVYGVNTCLSNFNSKTMTFDVVYKRDVLDYLQFNPEEFVDFCILSKVDYNKNIKRIGIMTALSIIQEYSSIEAWHAKTKMDISVLCHETCRQIFSTYGYLEKGELYDTRYIEVYVDVEGIERVLALIGVYRYVIDETIKLFRPFTPIVKSS